MDDSHTVYAGWIAVTHHMLDYSHIVLVYLSALQPGLLLRNLNQLLLCVTARSTELT